MTTTSIESTTTAASTDSTNDSKAAHKLQQMRGDDSGYKSLEAQQSLAKILLQNQSLESQASLEHHGPSQSVDAQPTGRLEPPEKMSSLSEQQLTIPDSRYQPMDVQRNAEIAHPPRSASPARSPKSPFAFARLGHPSIDIGAETACTSARQSVDTPATITSSGYQSLDTPSFLAKTRFNFKFPVLKTGSQDTANRPLGSGNAEEQLSLRKAVSQDFGATGGGGASGVEKASVGRTLTSSLDRIRLQAGQYISSAVSQAESLLSRVLEQSSNSEHSTDDKEQSCPEQPSGGSVDDENAKQAEAAKLRQEQELENYSRDKFVSERDRAAFQPFRRPSVDEPEKDAHPAKDQEKTGEEQQEAKGKASHWQLVAQRTVGTPHEKVLRTSVSSVVADFRRGNAKTASKKRRDYRTRKRVEDLCGDLDAAAQTTYPNIRASFSSSDDQQTPAADDQELPQPTSQYLSNNPLVKFDIKTFHSTSPPHSSTVSPGPAPDKPELHSPWAGIACRPRTGERFDPRSAWKASSEPGTGVEPRLLRKHTDSVLEMHKGGMITGGREGNGSRVGARSCSLDAEPGGGHRMPTRARFVATRDSIEEENEQAPLS